MTALLWLTRDLRVHDHPALRAALDDGGGMVPVFCLDDRLLRGRHASGPRTQFLLDCLHDLGSALRERGSGLVVRQGPPERELPALAREVGAARVHVSDDSGPFARRRLDRVGRTVELCRHPGLHAVDDLAAIRTNAGGPYTVFSPFHRSWLGQPRRELAAAPRRLPPLPPSLRPGGLPSLDSLGLRQELTDPPQGGEAAGRARMSRFLRGDVLGYADARDALGAGRTSRLSAYLHFGCVSPRELEERAPRGEGTDAFRRQLCWRDFYAHVLLHHPRNARSEFQDRYRGQIAWSSAARRFEAWCAGETGFPLVDAGMRQLRREGWMHNRARLVAGSFLTKDLGIDWRWGERWFMRMLVDGRRGQQQRQLAVDRLGRRRPPAGVPAHLQPGAPPGALRPVRDVRAPLCRGAARRAGRVPGGAVDDAGRRPAGGRLRDRRGLPGADRRPCRGAPRGAGAVSRLGHGAGAQASPRARRS